ncbi:pentapeptide repeat-containing protein [Candidatus Venteria ishoeyi]|uniref:Serine/threonine-protein kinase B n=1 Tax=Candidatus Venteria ishoeyi TaxID=1899563 RepID=A0A1H6F6G9_9GAMM|nr:pentapeptide repeat-containing protein [Candidatus Venteria ishoeyi]SEH04889.1 Serine/threonine-protein kinase B [Candidatus Venteria ishoeyi]
MLKTIKQVTLSSCLVLLISGYTSITHAADLGMKGGMVNNVGQVNGLTPVKNAKGNITLYEADDVPLADTPDKMQVNPGKWCSYTQEQRDQWRQEWNEIYKDQVTPGCANLFLEWKQSRACQGLPDARGDWKPSLKLSGSGKNHADLPDSIDKFIQQKSCKGCNIELASFQCLNLKNFDFSDSNLKRADFYAASLQNANFSNAQIDRSLMTSSHLSSADFSHANINDSYLSGSDLKSASFKSAKLNKVDMQSAELAGANFSGATLENVSLQKANLNGANFSGAKIGANVNFEGATLRGVTGLSKAQSAQPEKKNRKRKDK